MPSKLTKAQKKLAKVKNDISTILAKHKVEAALTAPTEVTMNISLKQKSGCPTEMCPSTGKAQDANVASICEGE